MTIPLTWLPWLLLGAFITVSAAIGAGYFKGAETARATIAAKLAEDRVTILQDGKEIDHEVLGADDAGLCALLGGCQLPDGPGRD